MIHCKNVDPIIADHIENGVWKTMQSCTPHSVMLYRIEIRIALNPIEACFGGT